MLLQANFCIQMYKDIRLHVAVLYIFICVCYLQFSINGVQSQIEYKEILQNCNKDLSLTRLIKLPLCRSRVGKAHKT